MKNNMLLTPLQQKVFDFICQFQKDNGFTPSYADIAQHFHFSSDGTVRTYLEHLEKKGYIKRLKKARGLHILKRPDELDNTIPILGRIAAGEPRLAIEDYLGSINDIQELHKNEGRFGLIVKGDSMKDAGILEGDVAIIQKNTTISNGQIAAVMINEEATLKRIYFEKDNVRLEPENENYKAIFIPKSEFNASVIGKFIALIRKA